MRKILFIVLQLLCFSSILSAQSQHGFIISGLFGYGFGTNTTVSNMSDKTLQPYKYGAALRLGYRFDSNFYLGLAATFQYGESIEVITPFKTYSVETRIQYYGAEIGRFLPLNNQLFLCPYVGFGVGQLKGNFWGGQVSFGSDDIEAVSTGLRPYISPGVMFLYAIGGGLSIGTDFRYTAIADYDRANAPSLFLFIALGI